MKEETLPNEKRDLKKNFSNKFLNELDIILEKCFLMPKKKKEHFITKERLEIDIIKLLQNQKNFFKKDSIKDSIKQTGVFDNELNLIGRIININLVNETIEFEDMFNHYHVKNMNELNFFNFNTLECIAAFDKQKRVFDKFSYKDVYSFLMCEDALIRKRKEEQKECPRFSFTTIAPLKVKYGK